MSTIRVDNLEPSSGGTAFSTRGIAKCWINFNGTGTVAIRNSENVSSLTDNGKGLYTTNFTNSFNTADYSWAGSGMSNASTGTTAAMMLAAPLGGTITVNALQNSTHRSDSGNFDPEYVTNKIHGDLA